MKKLSFFLGIYLIVIGLFWLQNITFFKLQQMTADNIYQLGVEMLDKGYKYKFPDEDQRANFLVRYENSKTFLEKFRKERIDTIPWTGTIIGLCAGVTGGLYILSGICLIRKSKDARKFLKLGIRGFLIFYLILIVDLILLFCPFEQNLKHLMGPQYSFSLTGYLSGLIGGSICVIFTSIFYIGLPIYFIKRSKTQSQLN